MKKVVVITFGLLITLPAFGNNPINSDIASIAKVQHHETDSFQVSGNCGMCKKTIESSLAEVEGVVSATWNVSSKMVVVVYNPHSVSLTLIKQTVADSGYGTDTIKAKEKAYDGLPGCCKYDRK